MSYLFQNASSFNQDISTWDVSKVTTMEGMFEGATSFKQDISNWNPYLCTNMIDMFLGVDINNTDSLDNQANYNAMLESWGVTKLSNMRSNVTFNVGNSKYSSSEAVTGRNNLTTTKNWTITDLGDSSVYIPGTLEFSYVYAGNIYNDETVISNLPVLTYPNVFEIQNIVVDRLYITIEDVTNVTVTINSKFYEYAAYPSDFGFTFNNVVSFYNSNVSDLNMISSSNFPFSKMGNQFNGLEDVSVTIENDFQPYFLPGTSLRFCFGYCSNFNSDISNWDTLNVTDMSYMFSNATAFNQSINYNPDTGAWNTSNVVYMSYMFYAANSFDNTIDLWNTTSVTNMNGMFYEAVAFNQSINYNAGIGAWNTENVTDMSYMFSGAILFNTEIDLWVVSNVTNMSHMFSKANSFTGDISSWNVSKVTDMNNMFSGNSENIPIFNGDISNWDTSSVILMNGMFYYAQNFNQPIGSWTTANVTDMSFMFYEATTFNKDISLWNTTKVTNMGLMFWNASNFNIDISSWDISSVIYMSSMFDGATSFKQDLSNWTPSSCIDMTGMFSGIDLNNPDSNTNQTNYNALLKSWGIDKLSSMQSSTTEYIIAFNGGNSKYISQDAITGRDNLITQRGWTISDGGIGVPV
jgi:surface protein